MSALLSIRCGGAGEISVALSRAPIRTTLTNLDIHLIVSCYSFNNIGDSQIHTPAIPMTRWETDSVVSKFTNNDYVQSTAITKRNIMLWADGGDQTPLIVSKLPYLTSSHTYCRIYSMKVTDNNTNVSFALPIDSNTFNPHIHNILFDPDRPLVVTIVHSENLKSSGYSFNSFPDRQSAKDWAELYYQTKSSCNPASSGPGYDIRSSL